MSLRRLPPVPSSVLKKAAYAEPPGRVPRGYFDSLMDVTRTLLDRGLGMSAVADWLIERETLPPQRRTNFINSMTVRFTRLRYAERPPDAYAWQQSLGTNGAHAVPTGRTKALCGAIASFWHEPDEDQRKCRFCLHVIKKGSS